MLMHLISVATGGALGALTRYGIGLVISSPSIGLPAYIATISVNIVGCGIMGIMAALLQHNPAIAANIRPFVMIGFLGALTTFSSFALDSFHLLEKQQYVTMAAYMSLSFILSLSTFLIMYHAVKWGLA